MYIESEGHGPDVVILHGLPQPPAELRPLAEALREVFRVHLVHLPGYGESDAPALPYDFVAVETELVAELRDRGVESAAIVGLSGGCYRAFHLAIRSQLSVWAIVGIGPLAHVHEQNQVALRQYADALEAGIDMRMPALGRMFSAAWATKNPQEALAFVNGAFGAAPLPVVAAELRAICDMPDLRPEMAELSIPVTLRVGALDVATPPFLSEEIIGLLPNATLEVVPAVGHMLHVEDAPGTATAVRRALVQGLPRAKRLEVARGQLAPDCLPEDPAAIRRRVCSVACDVGGGHYATAFTLEEVDGAPFTAWGDAVGDAEVKRVWRPDEARALPAGVPAWSPTAPEPSQVDNFRSMLEAARDSTPEALLTVLQALYIPCRLRDQARALLYAPDGRFLAFLGVMSRDPMPAERLEDLQALVDSFREALLRADELAGVPLHAKGAPYFTCS